MKVILLSAGVRAEDILHESAECANRIRPSDLHMIINSTNTGYYSNAGGLRVVLPRSPPLKPKRGLSLTLRNVNCSTKYEDCGQKSCDYSVYAL